MAQKAALMEKFIDNIFNFNEFIQISLINIRVLKFSILKVDHGAKR